MSEPTHFLFCSPLTSPAGHRPSVHPSPFPFTPVWPCATPSIRIHIPCCAAPSQSLTSSLPPPATAALLAYSTSRSSNCNSSCLGHNFASLVVVGTDCHLAVCLYVFMPAFFYLHVCTHAMPASSPGALCVHAALAFFAASLAVPVTLLYVFMSVFLCPCHVMPCQRLLPLRCLVWWMLMWRNMASLVNH